MIEIERQLAKEIKNEIERLYLISKQINTNGTPYLTETKEPRSQNEKKYIQEVEQYEKPYFYYHLQYGFYHTEIRKTRNNNYEVKTNYECKKSKMEEETIETTRTYGNKIEFRYKNEDFEATTKNFRQSIIELLDRIKATEEHLLIY